MAFTVNEFRDLLEILRTKPEWKEELRRELLGEEILSLPGLIRDLTKVVEEMNKRLYRVEQDVAVLKTDVAALKGDSLERKYRERPFVYFRRILRKPKILTDSELDDLLSAALADGALTEEDIEEISRLDAVVRGRRISDDRVAYLAVEISTKIDDHDVERAVRRARLLEKIPGVIAIPVVAGEALTSEGAEAMKQATAWTVTDGHAVEVTASSA
ncbi:MAG: hypothetical protein RMN52_05025 [Anaerolineae bacterium]|nr:hypothetical protein [Candidatus Roseilinea sp.]MDW8449346.1 hypothetical protein [Anaerolineae bacterium]